MRSASVLLPACLAFLTMIGSLIVVLDAYSPASPHRYCATIDTEGATGSVSVQVDGSGSDSGSGTAQYLVNLDLNSFVTSSTCDYSKGLAYHIHSYWNSLDDSVSYPACTSSIAGLHYDPNFACGPNSQQHSSGCKSLERVYPHYNYTCNSTVYSHGQYSLCEVGDLSGKFGTLYPTSSSNLMFTVSTPLVDFLPPYPYNFNRADLDSNMWSSIVFHCKSPSFYLICAKLTTDSSSTCEADFRTMSASSDGSNSGYSGGSLAIGICVSAVGFFVIGFATLYILQKYFGLYVVDSKGVDSRDITLDSTQSGLHGVYYDRLISQQ